MANKIAGKLLDFLFHYNEVVAYLMICLFHWLH